MDVEFVRKSQAERDIAVWAEHLEEQHGLLLNAKPEVSGVDGGPLFGHDM